MHLIPIRSADDLNFNRRKLSPGREEFLEVQRLLTNAIATQA
jgi:hypothetical protein